LIATAPRLSSAVAALPPARITSPIAGPLVRVQSAGERSRAEGGGWVSIAEQPPIAQASRTVAIGPGGRRREPVMGSSPGDS